MNSLLSQQPTSIKGKWEYFGIIMSELDLYLL